MSLGTNKSEARRTVSLPTPGPRHAVSPKQPPPAVPLFPWLCPLLFALSLLLSLLEAPAIPCEIGPLWAQFPLTLATGERLEAVGPLFYSDHRGTQSTWAIPPIFAHSEDTDTDSEEFDFLYPLMTYDRFGEQYRWQFGQLINITGGPTQEEDPRDRFSIFPFYFQQRSSNSNENYTALVPFYGHLKNRLWRDDIFFVLFPLYSQSQKRDVHTRNYLYPVFHTREGDGLKGWQAWPLLGHETKSVTLITNRFEQVLTNGGHDKWFALWPIFHRQKSGLGTTNEESHLAILPAYSSLRSTNRNTTSVLWPIFNVIDDNVKKYHEWQGPWPFLVVARGEGKNITRFWPLFAHAKSPTKSIRTYLWPVYRRTRMQSAPLDRDRTVIGYFLYCHMKELNTETKEFRRRNDLFPLFTSRREFDGSTRFQVLAILEPFMPNNKSIERSWSPLWSLWRNERNATTGATSQSLLWNLYHRQNREDSSKTSVLFGLFQREKDSSGSRWRVLYVPFGKNRGTDPNPGVR